MNTSAATVPQPKTAPPMRVLRLQVRFLNPAFLGDTEQNGRWRTPPFKAQLRQWWRMVWAADHGYSINLADMRREEGLLFGNAWLSHREGNREVTDHCKSLVRLRLDRWDEGKLKKSQWPQDATVTHPEVPRPTGSALYLGYGPLTYDNQRRATGLKANAAIQAGESALLSLAFPTTHDATELKAVVEKNAPRIERALWLMHRFGTVGGRSRNGWGSYELMRVNGTPQLEGEIPLRAWRDCLNLDWPHAIGKDEKGPLIWRTAPHDDWKSLMRTLAIVKIGLRTQFAFTLNSSVGDKQIFKNGQPAGIDHAEAQRRHWLSYPVTKHSVQPWDAEFVNGKRKPLNLRLPNQLRFKVRKTAEGKLVGVIFHVPHLPPDAFRPNRALSNIVEVWRCVHQFLEALTEPPGNRRYCQIADMDALAKQKAQLDQVRLESRSKP